MGCNDSKPQHHTRRNDDVVVVARGPTAAVNGKNVGRHKIVILGNVCVGKTCILRRFVFGEFDEAHNATVSANFCKVSVCLGPDHNNREVTLDAWDTAGQERFHMVRAYLRACEDVCSSAVRQSYSVDGFSGGQWSIVRWTNQSVA